MLLVNQLIGFGAGGGSASASFVSSGSSASDLTTYTFAGLSMGAASADRYIVVGCWGAAAAGRTISGVTVGGVAATQLVALATWVGAPTAIYVVPLPTGATASVVITFNAGMVRSQCAVFAVYGLTRSGTAVATATTATDGGSLNMNVQPGDVVIACASGNTTGDATWTGLTEAYDTAVESQKFTAAYANITAAESPRTMNCDWAGSVGSTNMVAAVLR